ncbi:hypothetical protein QR680_016515 [Steinernema hermaphroditum]|uniref:Uncharacterized protein n=1 Tax=Steinernema hermaphroditum TaxID=289476 RepID=A0AA39HCG8_9BILA|nr:hypothetical protein QR680_016515 [Steinernema hermaphroditum]
MNHITTLKLVRDYNLRISEKRKPPSPKYWTTPWANELMSNLPPMGKQRKVEEPRQRRGAEGSVWCK